MSAVKRGARDKCRILASKYCSRNWMLIFFILNYQIESALVRGRGLMLNDRDISLISQMSLELQKYGRLGPKSFHSNQYAYRRARYAAQETTPNNSLSLPASCHCYQGQPHPDSPPAEPPSPPSTHSSNAAATCASRDNNRLSTSNSGLQNARRETPRHP